MATASEYWNQKYSQQAFASGKAPDSFLSQNIHRLQKGKALDIGMGEGQNAVYLATKGFKVKGIELSEVALQNATHLAKETQVSIEAVKSDLDLFMMGLMEYDSIIMINFKPSIARYYNEIVRALKQGGTLLVKSLMDDEMPEALGPEDAYKNYYYHSNELVRHFKDLKLLYYNEDRIEGKKTVCMIAQKPLDKDAAKYKLFDMQSDVKSGVSRQRELAEALFKKK